MRNISTLAIVGLALLCAPASADPVAKSPTGKWIVDFDDAQCIAMRNYGTTDSPLVLVLKQPVLGDVMQLSIVRRGTGGRFAEQHGASISWDGGKPVRITAVSSADQQSRNLLLQMNLDQPTFTLVSHAKSLHLRVNDQLDASFQLSNMDDVLKVLDQCVADLDRVWNVAAKGTTSPQLKKPAQGSLRGLLNPDDYPDAAANRNQSGAVHFALLIDETGKVADCTVIQTSGIAALDAQSCFLVKDRAHFTPAVGIDGRPAKDAAIETVIWRIEQ